MEAEVRAPRLIDDERDAGLVGDAASPSTSAQSP